VLHRLTQARFDQSDVTWHWLKGHAGHPLNERADRLATEARRALRRLRSPDRRPNAPDVRQPRFDQTDDGRPTVEICVNASCRGAKRQGGWGAVLRMDEHTKSISGGEPTTTANAMLIQGATEALRALAKPCQVTVYSNAKYLIQGASQWVKGWQARGWQTKDGKPVANRAAWEALLGAARPHHVTWLQVKGDDAPADLAWAGELASEAARLGETVD
jgi:ribonuclease HI